MCAVVFREQSDVPVRHPWVELRGRGGLPTVPYSVVLFPDSLHEASHIPWFDYCRREFVFQLRFTTTVVDPGMNLVVQSKEAAAHLLSDQN